MQDLTLANGWSIPQLGYGVYTMTSEEVGRCLPQAIRLGYTPSTPPMPTSTRSPWVAPSASPESVARTSL